MTDYMTEAEQIALLKKIWKEYGIPAVIGVVLAVALVFSWKYYRQYTTQRAEVASIAYAHLMIDELNNQTADAITQANLLHEQFSNTPYATLALLFIAKQNVAAEKYDDAQQQLQWVIAHGAGNAFRQIARIRSARISLEQQKPNDALKILEKVNAPSFESLVAEVKGDAYLQLGQVDKARVLYQDALNHLSGNAAMQPLLQMKLEALPVSNIK